MNNNIVVTKARKQIQVLDDLPTFDRSLIEYSKYNKSVGHAGVKYSMSVQATRGCPYRCFYCDVYKTTLHHFRRSVDNIFDEVKLLSDLGVKRIEFIDDIFNVNVYIVNTMAIPMVTTMTITMIITLVTTWP